MAKHEVNVVVKALDRASGKFGRIGQAAVRMGRVLKKAAIGIAAAMTAAAVGLSIMVKRALESIDATAKLSDRIGIETEDLTALQFAAKLAGSSAEAFNKSIEKMVRGLGEVKMGVGQAKYALEALGLSVDDLIDKDPAQTFELLAKEIAKLPTAADRASVAYYLMGRRGMELLNLMEQLERDGLAAVRAEAERLGITFSRLDAAKVEAANDAMTRLNAVLTGAVQTLTIELAPTLEAATNQFIEMGTAGGGMGEIVVDALEAMTKSAVYFADQIEKCRMILKGVWALTKDWGRVMLPLEGFPIQLKNIDDYMVELAAWRSPSEKVEDFFDGLKRKSEQLSIKLEQAAEAKRKLSAEMGDLESFIKLGEGIEKVNNQLDEQIRLFGLTAREKQLAVLRKLGEDLKGQSLANFNQMLNEVEKKMTKLNEIDVFAKLEESAKSLVETLKSPIDKFKELRGEYEKMLAAGLITGEQFEQALRKASEDILKINKEKILKQSTGLAPLQAELLHFAPGTRLNYEQETAKNTKETIKQMWMQIKLQKELLREIRHRLPYRPQNPPEITTTNFA